MLTSVYTSRLAKPEQPIKEPVVSSLGLILKTKPILRPTKLVRLHLTATLEFGTHVKKKGFF